jgi:hypothetical protein
MNVTFQNTQATDYSSKVFATLRLRFKIVLHENNIPSIRLFA